MTNTARTVDSRIIYAGRIFEVTVDRVELPGGRTVSLEVVRHPASVVLIPMPDERHVTLIRQYRYAINRWIWELPAGSVDRDETPESAARRECHEEIGLVPRHLQRLGSFFPTPGFCTEEMIFFLASGLETPARAAALDEDEQLEPRVFELAEVHRMSASGEIVDMKTLVGLTLVGP